MSGSRTSPRSKVQVPSSICPRAIGLPVGRIGLRLLLGLLLFVAAPRFVLASGEERSSVGDDLMIRTDTRWCGGVEGGYLPIRVEVVNRGPARNLKFVMTPNAARGGIEGATVERTIGAEQNATVRFTLAVPLVGYTFGRLQVLHRGRTLEAHERTISLPGWFYVATAPPAMLVISPEAVECGRYADAANYVHSSGSGAGFRGGPAIDKSALTETVPPTLLPESWIDYSGLDLVAISRGELERLERTSRSALLAWVHCGGTLLVYEVGAGAQALEQLDRLLEIPDHAMRGPAWGAVNMAARGTIELSSESEEEATGMPRRAPAGPRGRVKAKPARKPAKAAESSWPAGSEAFSQRDLMLGTVYAFRENPFPGRSSDWAWFLTTVGTQRTNWVERNGVSPHNGTEDFFEFMIPGIRGVPVAGFILLSTLFTVVIGPVNYIYLHRKKRLSLLLITVPVVAFATSLLLVGYSMAAHGFSVRSRIRSLTVLDQKSRTSVTTARLSMFAGMAPADGLKFTPETAIYPVLPPGGELRSPVVDWTETQGLVSGWLPSRTRTQFFTVRHADERARVEVKPASGSKVEISNGLPWDAVAFVVSDDAGKLFLGRNIAANASAVLSEPSEDDLREVAKLLTVNKPALPKNFAMPAITGPRGRAYMAGSASTGFATSQMERRIAGLEKNLPDKKGLVPRSYLAILKENPGVETGGVKTVEQMGFHLIQGYY